MVRKKNDNIPKSDFDINESQDLLSFDSNENLGDCIATFSFGNTSDSSLNILPNNNDNTYIDNNTTKRLFNNRTTPVPNGATPILDGETPNVKRTYTLRDSTVRKLNELKSIHPDISVCVSTIVDIALEHYHKYITEEGGIQ